MVAVFMIPNARSMEKVGPALVLGGTWEAEVQLVSGTRGVGHDRDFGIP